MIEKINRFIAYICPECSGVSDKYISLFEFSGKKNIELCCIDKYCKSKSVILTNISDKMKINIVCPVCTQNHSFSISTNKFWSTDIITFDCPNAGIPIFFAGQEEKVIDAVNESEKMFEETENTADDITGELSLVLCTLDCIHEVLDQKRMICRCGGRNIYPVFDKEQMYVECEDCKKKYPINPSEELLSLLATSKGDFQL